MWPFIAIACFAWLFLSAAWYGWGRSTPMALWYAAAILAATGGFGLGFVLRAAWDLVKLFSGKA